MGVIIMTIEFDRRHTFSFDTDGQIRLFCAYRLDRLWRGEPDAVMPELASQRVRFAILHIERFSKPPRVIVEYYPMLTFDADGNLDLELQYAQLHADVDHLEAIDYAPTSEPSESESTWTPESTTRRRLIAATKPSYASRGSQPTPHNGVPTTARGSSARPALAPPTRPTPHHLRPATPPASAPRRR